PWSRLLGGTPRPVQWALAGQLAALLLLAATVAFGPVRRFQPGSSAPAAPAAPAPARTAAFVTLSAPAAGGEPSAAAARPQIRLVFVETATEKQMRYVLLCTRGRLVDGPSPLGAYTLELPAPTSAAGAPETQGIPKNPAGAAGAGETAPALPAPRAALAEAAPDSVGTVLAYLRSQPVVRFAEPVAGTTSPAPSSAWQAAPAGAAAVQGSPPPSRP
ncbi:MAG TPA: hypothetical protein VE075_01650, partial [Thermoanaerobaculia bacterium]|nr:hypothetical protein [Thermoanaerobaculia bacterium]